MHIAQTRGGTCAKKKRSTQAAHLHARRRWRGGVRPCSTRVSDNATWIRGGLLGRASHQPSASSWALLPGRFVLGWVPGSLGSCRSPARGLGLGLCVCASREPACLDDHGQDTWLSPGNMRVLLNPAQSWLFCWQRATERHRPHLQGCTARHQQATSLGCHARVHPS